MADTATPGGQADKGLSATALFLILGGLSLLVLAMLSKHWLEAPPEYRRDPMIVRGLFGDAGSSGTRLLGTVLMVLSGALALIGLMLRQVMTVAIVLAVCAGAALSWWMSDQSEWFAGRAYTLAMFALVVMIVGLAQGAASAGPSAKSVGSFVDGKKHGRWYVYDDGGKCIAMEDWEHGTLVSTKPQS